MTILEIKAKVRRLASEHGISLVIVDYLQLIHSNITIESEDKKISEISRSLKAFAKELDVPIIVLFQLTRSVDDGTATEPKIADFKELYEIEQDADVIFFIHRDEIHKKSGDNLKKGKAEIIIAKQRNGPVGTVKLGFIEEYASFECL